MCVGGVRWLSKVGEGLVRKAAPGVSQALWASKMAQPGKGDCRQSRPLEFIPRTLPVTAFNCQSQLAIVNDILITLHLLQSPLHSPTFRQAQGCPSLALLFSYHPLRPQISPLTFVQICEYLGCSFSAKSFVAAAPSIWNILF